MSVDLETSRAEAQMRHAATAERMRMMQSCEGQKAAIEQGILNQMMLYEKARSEEDLKRAQEDMVKHAEDMQSKLNVEVVSFSGRWNLVCSPRSELVRKLFMFGGLAISACDTGVTRQHTVGPPRLF